MEITSKSFHIHKTSFYHIKEYLLLWYNSITDDKQKEINLVTKALTFFTVFNRKVPLFKNRLYIRPNCSMTHTMP